MRLAHAPRRAQKRPRLTLAHGCFSFLFAGAADLAASRSVCWCTRSTRTDSCSRVESRSGAPAIERATHVAHVIHAIPRSRRIRELAGRAALSRFRHTAGLYGCAKATSATPVMRRQAWAEPGNPGIRGRRYECMRGASRSRPASRGSRLEPLRRARLTGMLLRSNEGKDAMWRAHAPVEDIAGGGAPRHDHR